jgi:hypothetical protein
VGWYLRKSFSFGPLRLNLSKSGLGYSFGVKGARIGSGPRGNYVHMGRYGLYYRQYFNQNATNSTPGNAIPVIPTELPVVGTIIPTADVTQFQDSSAEELLSYIREQHSKKVLAPWVSAGAGLLVVGMLTREVALWLVASCIVLTIVAHFVINRFDAGRKRVTLGYTLDESARAQYDSLLDSMKALFSSNRIWRVITSDRSLDTKYTSGATDIISRKGAVITMRPPPHVVVNVPVWNMGLSDQSLYFFPDRILVYQGAEIGAVPYADLNATTSTTRYVESEGVPSDARVVGTTWRYTNKGGGPDRRFANNPQIPVAEYAQIVLRSKTGLNFLLHCSNVTAAHKFVDGLSGYCSTVVTAHVAEHSGTSTSDSTEASLTSSALEGWGWAAAPVLLIGMLLAMFVGPHGSYLQESPPQNPAPTAVIQQPLPEVRILRQKGMQVVMAIPAETSDSDLLRVLDDLRVKVESARFSELGIKTVSPVSKGAIFVFRIDGKIIPALSQSDATLKWTRKEITGTLRKADGTRVPAFGLDRAPGGGR